jgi:hypothetical protein
MKKNQREIAGKAKPKKRNWGESKTVPGLDYELGDLVRRFQAGGVISQELAREGEYTGDKIPPEQSPEMVDLVDYQKFKEKVDTALKAAEAAKKQEAKAKALEEEAQKFKDWAKEKGYTINDATTNKNDDATNNE